MDVKMVKKLSNFSVLYAEDDLKVQKNLHEFLSLLFKEVYVANDGQEAYDIFLEKKPDLVITDIKMPKLSGIELAKKIRQDNSQTYIIVITAYTEVEYMLDAIELLLLRYIVKPITEVKLVDALSKFLALNEKSHMQEFAEGWIYDNHHKTILHDGDVYELTKKEVRLMELLLMKDAIISYSEIEEKLWENECMSLNALRLMIKNFRKKLPSGSLKNIQGIGYKL